VSGLSIRQKICLGRAAYDHGAMKGESINLVTQSNTMRTFLSLERRELVKRQGSRFVVTVKGMDLIDRERWPALDKWWWHK